MLQKSCNPEERFQLDDRQTVGRASRRRSREKKLLAELDPAAPTPAPVEILLRPGLLLAALRVWELKHWIHDYY